MYANKKYTYHLCGATLLSANTAMTAAHCLRRRVTYYLAMGITDLNYFRTSSFQISRISRIDIHPDYVNGLLANDIAIITLQNPMALTKHVNTISPWYNLLPPALFPKCQLNGWGLTQRGSTSVLQTAVFKIYNFFACKKHWSDKTGRTDLISLKKDICAKSETSAVCYGDSGSPLVCNNKVMGVLSWADSQCTPNTPGVFTRIHGYEKFVKDILDTNNKNIG